MNRHDPPEPVSHVLKTRKAGKLRNDVDITQHDFWVSRLVPDSPLRQTRLPELRFVDVAGNTSEPEPIAGNAVVLWHNSELFHIPRGEDFGRVGYDRDAGAAINSYAGFDLIPVNLWHKTPFLDRDN